MDLLRITKSKIECRTQHFCCFENENNFGDFFFDNFIKEPGLWQNYFTLVLKVPKNENLIGNVFRTYVRLVWVDILAFGLVDIFAFGLNSNEKWDFNKKEIILLIKV